MNIINIMLPVILLVFTGWFLTKTNLLNVEAETYLNKLIFNLSLPAIMLVSIDQYGINKIFDIGFAIAYVLSISLTFILSLIIFKFLKKYNLADCIFIGMNASISNSGLIALPILLGIFGIVGGIPTAAMLTITSILVVPILLLITEYEVQDKKINKLLVFFIALRNTLMQPFIFTTIIAAGLSALSIQIPKSISPYLGYLADMLVPCALIAVGIRLASSKLQAIKKDVIFVAILNLLIKPLIALALAILLHLSKLYSIALLVVSAAPVANSIYILSAKYNIYKSESAEISFLTMALSVFSLPGFLWVASYYWP